MGSGQSFDFNPDSIFLPAPAPAPDDSGLLAPTAFDSSSMDANAEWLLTSNNDGLDPGFLESSCVEGSDPGSSPFGKTRRHRKREDSMCLQESPQKLKTPVNPGLKVPGLDEIDQNLQQSSWFSSDDPGDQCYPPYTVALCCTGSNPANWATGVYILVEGCSRSMFSDLLTIDVEGGGKIT